nr:hypothetical protein [Bacteroidota bacterium]
MKSLLKYTTYLLLLMMFFSCKTKHGEIITGRITYDVGIKNTDPDADWWSNNLPGPEREKFTEDLFDRVRSGKQRAYKFNGDVMSVQEITEIIISETKISLQRPDPPYAFYDTIVTQELDLRDVTRIRFIEEWYNNNGVISKKVMGMAPVVENYGPDGKFRGYEALFWVFNDDEVPEFIRKQ